MKQVKGGVTAAKGFEAASTAAGIKYKDRTDMALVYSQVPCVAAGTFTTNVVKSSTGQMGSAGCKKRGKSTGSRCKLRNRQCLHRSRRIWIL